MEQKRVVLPLMGSTFAPGTATKIINQMEDKELAEIAQAEAYYFSAQAKECIQIVEKYLDSEDINLRMSADALYTFANMTLGNLSAIQAARADVYRCLRKALEDDTDVEAQTTCLFVLYMISVLIHIPIEKEFPSLKYYLRYLPKGQRLFALHMMAHSAYLEKEYAKGQGIAQAALALQDEWYPIPFVYLKCVEAMCQINQKDTQGACESVMQAWKIAKEDHFFEPFIEYHSLLQGVVEVFFKQQEMKAHKIMLERVIAFSFGWRKIHNATTQRSVTDLLTPMEYSIAMLACRDWTNQEIAEYMKISVNTVKHYVSTILEKLQINKRDKIRDFVNQ